MNMNNREEMELDFLRLLGVLWRKAWVIALTTIVFGVCALIVNTAFITPRYKATAMMYVNSSSISVGSTKLSISQAELTAAQSLVDTYIVILNTRTTLEEVIAQSGVNYRYEELKKMISASAVNSTEVFSVEVTSRDPKEAELLANTITYVLPERISSVVEGSSVRIVDSAVEPVKKASPRTVLNTVICMVLGAILACIAVTVGELMDRKIHGSDYLIQTYDIPLLAVIPDLLSSGNTGDYSKSAAQEANHVRSR